MKKNVESREYKIISFISQFTSIKHKDDFPALQGYYDYESKVWIGADIALSRSKTKSVKIISEDENYDI